MLLRSELTPEPFKNKIDYSKRVMFIGSCFSENIGQKLSDLKVPCIVNPFGILYNPESVRQSLLDIISARKFHAYDLSFYNEKWMSFAHHGRFSGDNKNDVLRNINKSIIEANIFLKQTDVLYITFGTFKAYKHIEKDIIVANCHKLPKQNFNNFLLDIDSVFSSYCKLIEALQEFNPKLEIVFTVSPVRHWKDGAVSNQLSKSYLFILIHKLLEKYSKSHYFPSYEIMMDDLRDYRFYAEDLFHPNSLAVDYIWEKFEQTFFSEVTVNIAKRIKKLNSKINHKAFYPESDSHKRFMEQGLEDAKELQKILPNIDLCKELEYFK